MATSKKKEAELYGRVPPQALDLEEAVLGAIMLERDSLDICLGILPFPECFYSDAHQKIYAAILEISRLGKPIDLLTVTDQLRKKNELKKIGDAHYLTELTMSVVSSAHVEAHAYILKEKYYSRGLIKLVHDLLGKVYDGGDVFDLAASIIKNIQQLIFNDGGATVHISRVAKQMIDDIEDRRKNQGVLKGVYTGISSFQELTKGWKPGDVVVLGARPGRGKTAFALNLAYSAASYSKKPVPTLIFSLEMMSPSLIERIASSESTVLYENIQDGQLSEEDMERLVKTAGKISSVPIYINDASNLNVFQMIAIMRTYKVKYGIGLVIIDHLQLISASDPKMIREQQLAEITRELKKEANELGLIIIELSQLNRNSDSRSEPIPKLSDLRESGAIEQDADMVMFLYFTVDEMSGKVRHMISIQKHRSGKLGEIEVKFHGSIMKWVDASYGPDVFDKHDEGGGYIPKVYQKISNKTNNDDWGQ